MLCFHVPFVDVVACRANAENCRLYGVSALPHDMQLLGFTRATVSNDACKRKERRGGVRRRRGRMGGVRRRRERGQNGVGC
jgi:hypothetical protein